MFHNAPRFLAYSRQYSQIFPVTSFFPGHHTLLLNIYRYPNLNKSHYSPSDIFYLYSKSAKTYFRTYAHSYCITVSTRTINLPPCPTMNADTASSLVSRHNNLRSWRQLFMFPTCDGLVDLSLAIGKKAATPKNVSHYQPDYYPNLPKCRPVYRFDPTLYFGAEDEEKLINDVKRSLVGVNYFLDNKYNNDDYFVVRLVCSFSKKLKKDTKYKEECFMKVGTKMEPLKGRGLSTFDRFDNAKLKPSKNTTAVKKKP